MKTKRQAPTEQELAICWAVWGYGKTSVEVARTVGSTPAAIRMLLVRLRRRFPDLCKAFPPRRGTRAVAA